MRTRTPRSPTLAHHLAPSGKRILLIERGDRLPREKGIAGTV
ncbi:MAG TPA: hypothetical protein VJT73_05535 [Polyangiaceae bacterium]|nr:hypothetical protein [Polyangiaceae bacterium]